MQFYIKNESGEFTAASESQIEDAFRERSDAIVSKRLASIKDKELEKARPEFEKKVREEVTAGIEKTLREQIEGEYKGKLEEADKAIAEKDILLRRKTIAAEYGFKPDAEEFLGNGTDDEMRAKADTLKNTFGANSGGGDLPNKTGTEPPSETAEQYGLDIKI